MNPLISTRWSVQDAAVTSMLDTALCLTDSTVAMGKLKCIVCTYTWIGQEMVINRGMKRDSPYNQKNSTTIH